MLLKICLRGPFVFFVAGFLFNCLFVCLYVCFFYYIYYFHFNHKVMLLAYGWTVVRRKLKAQTRFQLVCLSRQATKKIKILTIACQYVFIFFRFARWCFIGLF